MNILYTKKVLQHFRHPKNMGVIKNPDGMATMGNPVCGDVMKIYIKIGKNTKNEDIIRDIKFQTLGCAAAIATSSITTQMVKGKSLVQLEKINNLAVIKALGGLPKTKIHCSLLAVQATKKAIENYKLKQKQ